MKLTMNEHGVFVRQALTEGESYRWIADELGCNKDTVSVFAKLNFPELRRKAGAPKKPDQKPALRILLIDIETAPNLAHVWGIWDQNIGLDQLVSSTEMLCWAAKWLDEPLVRFKSSFYDGHEEMVQCAWNLLDRADVVMHYNGRTFDVPHLNREFLQTGLTPPSPFKQIDLLATVRKQFKFPSYKLAYVSKALGLEGKVEHEGFKLWLRCLDGDDEAWERMAKYNVQDVQLLQELYERLLPWIVGHPSIGAATGEDVCPNCGSGDLEASGTTITKTGRFPQYHCNGCGTWSRDTKREASTARTSVAP